MNLTEMLELMALFGYEPGEVKRRLAHGDSVHNAWSGLQLELQLKWNEMNQELGTARLTELRPAYEKLQGLKLKSARKQSEVDEENRERWEHLAGQAKRGIENQGRKNLTEFMRVLEDQFARMVKKDPSDKRAKEVLEKLRRGELPF